MRSKFIITAILISFLTFAVCGCGSPGDGDTDWKFESRIKEPISAKCSTKKVTIGDLKTNDVKLEVPGKSFDKSAEVTISPPKSVPKYVGKEMVPVGAPIQITAGDEPVRLNQPVTMTIKYDKEIFGKDTDTGRLVVAYFDGQTWEYLKPESIDKDAGTLTFITYHFSFFGAAKVDVEEQLNQIVKSQSLSKYLQSNVDDVVDKTAEAVIDKMLTGALGLKEESIKNKVLGSVLKDDEYKDMYDAYKAGDVTGFNEKLNILIGKKIAENVSESTLQSALNGLVDDKGVEYVQAVSQALGFLAEGQYEDAARIVGEKIADEFPLTLAIKVSAELIDYKIQTWKNSEIEAAYKAYKDGSDSHFWGYNVDKGDFDAVWTQMRGIATRLMSEAIERENRLRDEVGLPPLNDKQMDKLRQEVKDDLEQQFKDREKAEDELATEEAKMKKLIDAYRSAKLLDPGSFNYSGAMDTLESRIEKLIHFKDKVLRDIGRDDLTDGAFTTDKNLSINELMVLTQAWFTKDGYKKYADLIKEKFGIDIYPTAEQILGQWSGTLTIKELNFPETPTDAAAPQSETSSEGLEGCDMSALGPAIVKALEELVGKPLPMTLSLAGDKTGNGTATMTVNAGDSSSPTTGQYTYSYGHLTVTMASENGSGKLEGNIEKLDQGRFAINGTIVFGDKTAGMSGVWNVTK